MRRQIWIPVGALAVLLLTLVFLPPERHLGRLLTLIYLHGALIRVGMVLFVAGAIVAIAFLATRRQWAWQWTRALQVTAFSTWALGFIISFYPTYVTWGTPIAWSEPRTQMVVRVLVVAGLAFGVARWLNSPLLVAGSSALIGLTIPILVWQTGVIRHPLNPIGESPSFMLRAAYILIVLSLLIIALWETACIAEKLPDTKTGR